MNNQTKLESYNIYLYLKIQKYSTHKYFRGPVDCPELTKCALVDPKTNMDECILKSSAQ